MTIAALPKQVYTIGDETRKVLIMALESYEASLLELRRRMKSNRFLVDLATNKIDLVRFERLRLERLPEHHKATTIEHLSDSECATK